MGRVEKRMYKQRKRRRWMLFLLLLAAAAVFAWYKLPEGFLIERISDKTKATADADDQTVETREVTLPEETWYAIQTGVFSTEEAARQKAEAYTGRGAPGTVILDGAKWRVFIVCYDSESDAASVKSRLETNQHVETYLYAWKMPEVQLRLTGKRGQLDAVEAGFTLLTSAATTLRDAAVDLDAAQLTNTEACDIVVAMGDAIALWENTVRDRFGRKPPSLVKDMQSIADGWDARQQSILAADDATALSAALKAQAMGLYDEIIAWRNALVAQ